MIVRGLSRRAAVLASVLLGGALLGTGLLGWVRAEGTSALDGRVPIEVVGSGAAPAVTAAGLAVLAAGVAALLVGTGGRFVVAAALGAAAVVVVATSLGVVSDPASVASSEAARLTGVPVGRGDDDVGSVDRCGARRRRVPRGGRRAAGWSRVAATFRPARAPVVSPAWRGPSCGRRRRCAVGRAVARA